MKHLLTFFLLISSAHTYGQSGEWTWMQGDSTFNNTGSFGTLGIPNPSNTPPGTYEPAFWTDLNGNLWMYGGYVYPQMSYATALWKFDVALNQWVWINGSTAVNKSGNYGSMGVPAASNLPGSRCCGVYTWTDQGGDMWMYGGQGYDDIGNFGPLGDLWKYNIASDEWTWIRDSKLASSNPVFGTFQVASSSNTPGGLDESKTAWTDGNGDFWLFGGRGPLGSMGAVWKYSMSINQWAWMNGPTTSLVPPVYGTKGISSPNNTPGTRLSYAHWKDSSGKFWLFGGAPNFNAAADMWRYDPDINQWTWMSGSSQLGASGNAGYTCVPDSDFYPAARYENSASWADANGNFWMYGGLEPVSGDSYGDFWVYRTSHNDWTWVNGSLSLQQPAFFGTQGLGTVNTHPGNKNGLAAWMDASCNLWLFGGLYDDAPIYKFTNDVWKFVIDPTCPAVTLSCNYTSAAFSSDDTMVCEKFCVSFTDLSTNNPTSWQWIFPSGSPASSTLQNPTGICYAVPGVYDVTLITTGNNGTDTLTIPGFITVFPTPPFPVISQSGYILTSTFASSYQWQLNSTDIPGATNQSYTVLQTGLYSVVIGDSNGCQNSASQYVLISGIGNVDDNSNVSIFPNPSPDYFTVEVMNQKIFGAIGINVVNTMGQIIFSSSEKILSAIWKKEIELTKASPGVYFIEIKSEDIFRREKIIIEK